jgi:hypothetical protein
MELFRRSMSQSLQARELAEKEPAQALVSAASGPGGVADAVMPAAAEPAAPEEIEELVAPVQAVNVYG